MVQAFIVIVLIMIVVNHVQAIRLLVLEDCETGRPLASPLLRTEAGCQLGLYSRGSSYVVNCENDTLLEFSDSECKVLRGQATLGQCIRPHEFETFLLPKSPLGFMASCKNFEPPLLEKISFYDSSVCMKNSSQTSHALFLLDICWENTFGQVGSQKIIRSDTDNLTSDVFDSLDCTGNISRSYNILLNSCREYFIGGSSSIFKLNYGENHQTSSLIPVLSSRDKNNMSWIIILVLFIGMLILVRRYLVITRNHSVTLQNTAKQDTEMLKESLL